MNKIKNKTRKMRVKPEDSKKFFWVMLVFVLIIGIWIGVQGANQGMLTLATSAQGLTNQDGAIKVRIRALDASKVNESLYTIDQTAVVKDGQLKLRWQIPGTAKKKAAYIEVCAMDKRAGPSSSVKKACLEQPGDLGYNKVSCPYYVPANSTGFSGQLNGWNKLDDSQKVGCSDKQSFGKVSSIKALATAQSPGIEVDGGGVLVAKNGAIKATNVEDFVKDALAGQTYSTVYITNNIPVPGEQGKDGANGKDGVNGADGAVGIATVSGGGLILTGQNLSLDDSCLGGQILQWNGTEWVCASVSGTDSQTLSLASNVLAISGGNSVNLSGYLDNTDNQALSWNGGTRTLSLTSGGSVVIADSDTTYSAGNGLSLSGTTFSINSPTCAGTTKLQWNGSAFTCATDVDTDTTNFNVSANGGVGQNIASGGTVNFVNGTGTTASRSGSDITFGIANTAVSAGTYSPSNNANGSLALPQFTVDAQGRLTAASTTNVTLTGIANSQLANSAITVNTAGGLSGGSSVSLGGSINLTLDLSDAGDSTTASTSSGSGLEVSGSEIGLLRGCSSNQLLKWNSSSLRWECANDTDTDTNSGGTVTSITAGTGLSGGTITTSGTINIANTGVSAGTYGSSTSIPVITVNAQGQITSASSSAIPTASTSTTGLLTSTDWNTFNGKENVLTFTGNGLFSRSGNTVTGLACSVGQIPKWTAGAFACGADDNSGSSYSAGNGLSLSVSTFSINSPTCSGTDKLQWTGTAFVCSADVDTDTDTTNFNVAAAGTVGSQNISSGGTVTFGNGTGTTATRSGSTVTYGLNNTAVSAGTYSPSDNANGSIAVPQFTVDAQGRLTAASTANVTLTGIANSQLANSAITVNTAGGLIGGASVSLGGSVNLTLDLSDAGDSTTATTNSGSGLEVSGGEIGLLRGCSSSQLLKWNSSSLRWECANDTDTDTNSGGTVTSITAGTGLTGGTITTSGTINIAATGVTAATYGSSTSIPVITVNAQGQITAASSSAIPIADTSTTGLLTDTDWDTFNGKENVLTFNGNGLFSRSGNTVTGLACSTGQIPKWTAGAFACGADIDTDTTYSAGNGLSLGGTTFSINSPTCAGTDKLTWSGTAFSCASDVDTDTDTTNFNVAAAGTGGSQNISSGGTVTFGNGTGTTATRSGSTVTYGLNNTAVSAGTYSPSDNANGSLALPQFTVDAQGRLTAASTTNVTLTGIANAQLANSAITVNTAGGLTGGTSVSLGGSINLSLDLSDAGDSATATTNSGSGLEVSGGEIGLIRGCSNTQLLKWNSSSLRWECASDTDTNSGGTVTSVTAGTGLSGGTITTSGTINIANTGVTAATYGSSTSIPVITVNAQGQITAASSSAIPTADTSTTGLLTDTDWDTFNGKENVLTFNGNGLFSRSGNTVTGLSCSSGEIPKWSGSAFACATDAGGTSYSAGNGLSLSVSTFSINSPTCSGTDKLQWTGSAFVCSADVDTDTGVTSVGTIDSQTKSANGAVISGTSLVLQTADGSNPGLVSTGTQTFAGAKTFSGNVNANGDVTLGDAAADGITITGEIRGASPLAFEGATNDGVYTTFAITDPTVARTITFPDASGTVCLQGSASCAFISTTLADGQILIGNGSNVATAVTPSGDVTISNTGVTTIGANSVALGTDTTGNYVAGNTAGNGISVSGSAGEGWSPTISINAPTCAGTDKLTWNGTAFSCASDVDTDTDTTNFNVAAAGTGGSQNISSGGTVTFGNGTGTTATRSGSTVTYSLNNTAVSAGTYAPSDNANGSLAIPQFTVDAQGRLTAASTTNVTLTGIANSQLTNSSITVNTAGGLSGGASVSLGGTLNLTLDLSDAGDSTTATTNSGSGLEVSGGEIGLLRGCSNNQLLKWDSTNLRWACASDVDTDADTGVTSVGTIDSQTKSANGAVISGTVIYLQTADASNPGLVSTGTQTFAGNKTFNGNVIADASLNVNGDVTLGNAATDGITFTGEVRGASPLAFEGATNDGVYTTFAITDPTIARTVTFPDRSGTVSLSGDTFTGDVTGTLNSSGATTLTIAANSVALGTDTTGDYVSNITAGGGLTGTATGEGSTPTLAIVSSNGGILVNADDIALTIAASANALSSTTSSGSGLEILSSGLTLLQGCTNSQLLKWNETSDVWECANDVDTDTGVTSVGTIDSQTKSANGAVISGSSLYLQTADASNPGLVSTGTQTFAGNKTFNGNVVAGGSLSANGDVTLGDAATDAITFTGEIRGASPFAFEGATNDGVYTTFAITDPTVARTITFPDASGTVCLQASSSCGFISTTLSDGQILIGNGSNVATAVTPSGDVTISNSGVTTIGANSVALGTDTTGNYVAGNTAGNGISVSGSAGEGWSPTISINAPTCSGSDKLTWNGSAFSCATDIDTDTDTTNFNVAAQGTVGSQNIASGDTVTFNNGTGTTATRSGSTVTYSLNNTAVSAGTYAPSDNANGSLAIPQFTVDAQGRLTAASTTNVTLTGIANSQLTNSSITVNTAGGLSGGASVSLGGTLNLSLDLSDAGDSTTATTNSGSGLEVSGGEIGLLRGCSNNQLLKWDSTNLRWACANDVDTDTGVTSVGTIDSQTKSANGAVISGSVIYLQTADASNPGLVSTGTQTFAGNKTFSGNTVLSGTLNANGDITLGDATTDGITFTGEIRGASPLAFEGATNDGVYTTFAITDPTLARTITFPDRSGTASLSGDTFTGDVTGTLNSSGATALTIAANSVALGTDTTGNYVADVAAGTGLSVAGTPGEGWTPTVSLANTAVSAGTYAPADNANGSIAVPQFTVDAQGRLTAASTTNITPTGIANSQLANSSITVTAGNGLATGGLVSLGGTVTLDIGAGNGITVNANDITIDLTAATDALSSTTSSGSGLEVLSTGLTLLQGCSNSQILKWNETTDVWECSVDVDTDTGVTSIGTIDSQTKSANGAVISGTSLVLQTADASNPGLVSTGTQTFAGDKTFTGLVTANGGLTIEAGDTLTMNGDAFTDLTGSGLAISGGALIVDDTSATGFFRNSGNTFGAAGTLGTNDANVLNFETNNTNRFQLSASASTLTGQGTTTLNSTGSLNLGSTTSLNVNSGTTLSLNSAAGSALNIGTTSSGSTITLGNFTGATAIDINTGSGGLDIISAANVNATANNNLTLNTSSGDVTINSADSTIVVSQGDSVTAFQVQDSSNISLFNVDAATGLVTANNSLSVGANATITGLLTANGNLTLQTGDTFTMNGDAFTDLTGSGLTISGGALTVDASSSTGFFRNGGNTFGAAGTLGTNDANVLNIETNGTNRFQFSSSASTLTGQGATTLTSTGLLALSSAAASDLNITSGNNVNIVSNDTTVLSQNDSALAFQVQTSLATPLFNVDASTASTTVYSPYDSTTAFQVQNSIAGLLFNVDASTGSTTIASGGASGSTTNLQVLNGTGDQVMNVNTTNIVNNLITNPSFEVDDSGWTASTYGNVDTTQSYIGKSSYVVNAQSAGGGATYDVALASDTSYTLSFYAKVGADEYRSTFSNMYAGYFDGTSNVNCLSGQTVGASGWTRYSCTFTTGTTSGTPNIYIRQNDNIQRNIYIDGVQLLNNTLPSNVITGTSSTFESGVGSWGGYSSGAVTQSSAQAHMGTYSGRMVTTGGGNENGISYNYSGFSPSTTYTIKAYIKADAASASATYQLGHVTDNGQVTTVSDGCNIVTPTSSMWKVLTCTFTTAPVLRANPYITITQKTNLSTATTTYVDSISMYAGSDIGGVDQGFTMGNISLNGAISSPALFQNTSNSTTAFQIQGANSSNSLLVADTLNNRVAIGKALADYTLDVEGVINATESVRTPVVTSANATALSIDSGTTGALNIGTGANAKTITIGNATGATSVVVNCGTGACSFGANATAHTTTIGSATSTATTNIQSGTGNINLQAAGTGTTGRIQVGAGGAGSTTPDLFVLDIKSTSGDPTGTEAAMYYNTNTDKFRCYQNGAWADCITVDTGVTTIGTIDSQTKSANGAVISGNSLVLQTADATNPGLVSTGTQIFAGNKTFTGNVITNGSLQVDGSTTLGDATTDTITAKGSMIANAAATGTTDTTSGTGTNTTTVTIAGTAFADNDVILIDNAGQDYYTRVVSGGGTSTLTVSPAVTFENSRTVTKYNIQNIGATPSDYTTATNRFFQGYFLGGVVAGAGTTTLSDGRLSSTVGMNFDSPNYTFTNTSNSTSALRVNKANGESLIKFDTATNDNLLSNGTFEAGTSGWAAKGSATVSHNTSNAQIGSGSMSVATTAAANDGAKYNYSLASQTSYTLTFYAKTSISTTSYSTINVGRSEDGSTDSDCATSQTVYGSGWNKITCSFTTANVSGTPYIYIKQTDAVAKTLYIDSVQLQSTSAFNSNTDFESGNTGWGQYNVGSLTNSSAQAYTGSNSLQVETDPDAGTQDGAVINTGTVLPNTTYRASFMVRLDGTTAASKSFSLVKRFDTADGTTSTCTSATLTADTWTNITCTFTTGNVIAASPFIGITTLGASDSVTIYRFWIDNAVVAPVKWTSNDVGRISLNGSIDSPLTVRGAQDSLSAFQVQQQNGKSLLVVDTLNGRVGINTETPTKELEVNGKALLKATSSDTDTFQVQNTSGTSVFNIAANSRAVTVGNSSGTTNGSLSVYGTGLFKTMNSSGSATAFRVTDSSNAPVLTVSTSTGNKLVYIGAGGNDGKFQVVDAGGTASFDIDSSGTGYIYGTANFIQFDDALANPLISADGTTGFVSIGDYVGNANYKLDVVGDINSSTGYRIAGTAGATTTCSGGQFLQNQVVVGGLTTGGTCAAGGSGVTTVGTFSGSSQTNGASISGSTITFGPADGTNPGMVTTGTQTFAGNKTFTGNIITNSGLQVDGSTTLGDATADTITAKGSLIANASATGTTATTSGTGTNTTTVTLTGSAFANGDVILIDNAGQDYYTRVTAGGGTSTLTVSPAVTFETGRTVTKYNIQNIGATESDYTTQTNRFYQGYFLGGVVVGAGSTTLSDGLLSASGSSLNLYGGTADGASAVGLIFNSPNYTTSGAKLVSFRNNGTEKFSVDKDGNIDLATGAVVRIGGSAGVNGSCGSDQLVQNAIFTGGILTSGACTAAAVSSIGTIDSQTKAANGAVISGKILYLQTADASNPGLVSTGTQTFAGAKTFNNALTVSTSAVDTGINTVGNINSYYQINVQNTNSGSSASSDFVATANNGSATTYYVDFGINGSNGGAAPFTGANDAYLYASDSNNLHIGALGSSGAIKFYTTGGTSSPVQRLSLDSVGAMAQTAASTTGTAYTLTADSLTSGNGLAVGSTSTGLTGNLFSVTSASTSAFSTGGVRFNFTGAHTGSGVQIDDVTATGTVMKINANSLTSGSGLAIASTSTGLTGNLFSVTSASTSAFSTGGVRFNFTGAHTGNAIQVDDATTTGTVMQINANSLTSGSGLAVDSHTNGATGNLFSVTSWTNSALTNGVVRFNFTNAHTGNGFQLDDGTNSGTAMALNVNNLTSGNGLAIVSTSIGTTGNLFSVTSASTGAFTNGGIRYNFTGAHTGNGVQIDDATTTGTVYQINASALTTGTAFEITGPSAAKLLRVKNDNTQGFNQAQVIIGEGESNNPEALARDSLYVFGRINTSWNQMWTDCLTSEGTKTAATTATGVYGAAYSGSATTGRLAQGSVSGVSGVCRFTFATPAANATTYFGSGGASTTQRSLNPVFEARVLSDTNTDHRNIIGFTDMAASTAISADTNNSANEAFFRKTAAGTQWEAVTRSASGTEQTTTSVGATNAWHRLRIEMDDTNAAIRFYVDGSLVATHTTAAPTAVMGFTVGNSVTSTTSRTLDVDYMRVWSDDPPASIAPEGIAGGEGTETLVDSQTTTEEQPIEDDSNTALLGRIKDLETDVDELNQYKEVLSIETIGDSSLKKAIVLSDAQFKKQVEFLAQATFRSDVNVDGTLKASRLVVTNNTGDITLQPGQTEVQVLFLRPLGSKPNVFLSTENPDAKVVAQQRSATGFTIKLSQPLTEPLEVQWFATEKE